MWKNRERYRRQVADGLDKAYREAVIETLPLDGPGMILFSDLHRGTGDRADDFRPCRKIYHAALGYYASLKHRLFLLGDIEELWERLLLGIVTEYEGTLELEKRFFDEGRAVRMIGNHDDNLTWPWNRAVMKRFIDDAPLHGSYLLRFADGEGKMAGEILLVHGHQGITYSWLDRFVVKRVWTVIQKLTGISLGTPATDHGIRNLHERALYDWASRHPGLLLICGHTHHPVFMSAAWEETVRIELDELRAGGASEQVIAMKEAELHWIAAEMDEMRSSLPEDARPCYFNTGCCSFADGSITGVEIEGGHIRLVRWTGESGSPVRECLREADLANIFRTWAPSQQS